jgi:hypothetical protein
MEDNRFYIYCHVKKTDGKCFYIGKGCGFRYLQKTNRNPHWNNIVNKHGFESIILINNISEEKSFELESYFIKNIGLKNLSNNRIEQGTGGFSHSKETKLKISLNSKGKKRSQETINKMKKPKPEGFGENISKQRKGNWVIPQHQIDAGIKARNKVTEQYDKEGVLINAYESSKAAAEAIGVHEVNMRLHLSGKYKTCKGYIFKYQNTL